MSAFLALLQRQPFVDQERVKAIVAGLQPFGDVTHHANSAPAGSPLPDASFVAMRAAQPVERKPGYEETANGIHAVGVVRWTAKAELAANLGVSPYMDDVELLTKAYERWGVDLLEHVQGEFSFVLYDSRQGLLLAATDHFGARPLFYAQLSDGMLLSDSLIALRDSGLCGTELDETSAGDFLAVGFCLDPGATMYHGIRRLPPAYRLILQQDALHMGSYWRVPEREPMLLYKRKDEYAEQLREIFLQVVADRIPQSGRIGILLSGGMDSSSVAAAIRHALGHEAAAARVTGYTFVSRTVEEEEGHYSTIVANHLGIRHQKITVEDARLDPAVEPVRHLRPALPAVDHASFARTQPAIEIAATGGAVFTGQGGDALFRPTRRDVPRILNAGFRAPYVAARYAAIFRAVPDLGFRRWLAQRLRQGSSVVVPLWLQPGFVRRVGLEERVRQHFASVRLDAGGLQNPFWTNVLVAGSSSQTALPLEAHQPFFDIRLMRFARCLPDPLLRNKRLLRDAMRPYLPQGILARPKKPFGSIMTWSQIDPGLAERQIHLVDQAEPSLSALVDFSILKRSIGSPQPETILGLSRMESFLLWRAAREDTTVHK